MTITVFNRSNLMYLLTAALLSVLTAVQPVTAETEEATSRISLENDGSVERLSDLGTHINPMLGVSSFEYSGRSGSAKQKLSGGAIAEFGEGIRRMETGILILQSGGQAKLSNGRISQVTSTYLTLPMMAKFRVAQLKSQSWYIKGGFLTAVEMASSNDAATNNFDVLASLGAAGRFHFTKSADFLVEATYNRGLMEAIRTSAGSRDFNQGVMVLAGLSFKL